MRVKHRPDFYSEGVFMTEGDTEEPNTYQEAMACVDQSKWKAAMDAKMRLERNDVWDLVELPEKRKVVGIKWVFKLKTNEEGTTSRYKARLVAQGFSQQRGSDYDETFSPVARMESVRMIISLAVRCGLKLHQFDVTTAFLNGKLEEWSI